MSVSARSRLRVTLPLAAGASLLVGRIDLLSAKQGKRMFDTITYTSNVADEQFATKLQIGADGWGRLSLGSNSARRDRPIGLFQQPVPATLLQRLGGLATGADFAASATQPSLIPDEVYRQINVALPNQAPIAKLVGEKLVTPVPFGRLEAVLHEVIEYLQQFPQLAIGMRLQPMPARLVAGKALPIVLQLRNTGSTAFVVEMPALWGQKATHCEVRALRSDIPSADLRSEHQAFLQLDAKSFKRSEPAHGTTHAELLPSEQLGLWFEPPAAWPLGQYSLELSLSLSLFNRDKKLLFVGGLAGAPQQVVIEPPPR